MRGEQPQEETGLTRVEHEPRDHPEIERILKQNVWNRDTAKDGQPDALGRHPDVVDPHLQPERSRGILAVVRDEVVVHQFVDLARRFHRRLQFVIA